MEYDITHQICAPNTCNTATKSHAVRGEKKIKGGMGNR